MYSRLNSTVVSNLTCIKMLAVPACYSEGPLFRKSIVQIRTTVLTFGLKLGLRLKLRLGIGLVGIVDFRNSGPELCLPGAIKEVFS